MRTILWILKYGISASALVVLGIILAFLYPEKVQKWAAILLKFTAWAWKGAEKRIIRYDIEGRINEFTKSVVQKVPKLDPIGVSIRWIEEGETPEDFLEGNRLIIRMRQSANQDRNFVAASMVFIAKLVIRKAKKYMAPYQSRATDLYIGKMLLEKEKPGAVDYFFEEFFRPGVEGDRRVGELIEHYNLMDKAGVFFPVLLQELTFLGEKVFYRPRNALIVTEVRQLISFLTDYANRPVGATNTEVPLNFKGSFCRCGIWIVARQAKVQRGDIKPYLRYADNLLANRIENIYIVGPRNKQNVAFIKEIGKELEKKGLEKQFERKYEAQILVGTKRDIMPNYLVLYRSQNVQRYFDQEYQAQFIEPAPAAAEPPPR